MSPSHRRTGPFRSALNRVVCSTGLLLAACGGGPEPAQAGGTPADADLAFCNGAAYQQVLHASGGAAAPDPPVRDIRTLRIHDRRTDGEPAGRGLHLWHGAGVDVARLPPTTPPIGHWAAPVPLSALPGYRATADEVVLELPVLNPKDDASRAAVSFIVHGRGGAGQPGVDDKDGRSGDITVPFKAIALSGQVGDVWLVQGDAAVYPSAEAIAEVALDTAQGHWMNRALLRWAGAPTGGAYRLHWSAKASIAITAGQPVRGADGSVALTETTEVPPALAVRYAFVGDGAVLSLAEADQATVASHLGDQLVLVREAADGTALAATETQLAGLLDDRFAGAAAVQGLGATVGGGGTTFRLWAPTARRVRACVHDTGTGPATTLADLTRDADTGVWQLAHPGDLTGRYYTYLVDVHARGTGVVRNRVTDPYAASLTTDSRRAYIVDLSSPALKPAGWDDAAAPVVASPEDMSIYELHVRDFSLSDGTVPEPHRGKYLAFTHGGSNGMKHLKALAAAGLTDVHLLPVYDFGSVPEAGCASPPVSAVRADDPAPADALRAAADTDCFNWGYDPVHYTAPEGSYATDPADGARRILEFREMVAALHAAGLRVGMDVVYNHTFRHGQAEMSVLDRIVPGYYHRLSVDGAVETSTCCSNTATEHAMMARLMIDSVRTWATQYRIDSFRFDLMGHQPRSVMEQLQAEVDAAAGRSVFLIGEGWNFGEVADGARFVQASQLSLNGSGIGTFSDRARDRIRGGGCCDDGEGFRQQGHVTGLFYDPHETAGATGVAELLDHADILRVGLAGSLRSFAFEAADGQVRKGEDFAYGTAPAGYASQPREVVNYHENHDNRTFWDGLAAKMPRATSLEERMRAQVLAAAINSFSQGIAYFHAGTDVLRSKSMDNNSYNSGDWFNRLDWTYTTNHFGIGLPVSGDAALATSVFEPGLLPRLQPGGTEIRAASGMFRDLLRIRYSTPLFRLRSAEEVHARLRFLNTGPLQEPTVLVGHLDGAGLAGSAFREVLYAINVDKVAHTLDLASEVGKAYVLHPVHRDGTDRRPATAAVFDAATGRLTVPPRTALAYVVAP